MDLPHPKIACGILTGVAIISATLGFLCMFGIGHSRLSMISKLNKNSWEEEAFITEEIFERINVEAMGDYLTWLTKSPHPAGQQRDREIADWIKNSFEKLDLDHVMVQSYEVMLSYPSGSNKVRP